MQTCLVTGGAGFIGSNLVEALLKRGARVRVLDNLATGRMANLAPFLADIEFIQGDIRDIEIVRRAVAGIELVFHQAAIPAVQRSIDDPLATNEVNVTGTLHVLLAARDAGVQRVVFASSSSVYGNSPNLPKRESMPVEPLSPYAVSKLAGERYCQAWTEVYGMPTIALRYFNVFGPRQDPRSDYAAVIPRFVTSMLQGHAPIIYGDGQQSRDFTYIDNVIAANLCAAEAPATVSGYFNVACGERISLLHLIDAINRCLGTAIAPQHGTPRTGDVKHSQADIRLIRTALGYEPVVDFAEGLHHTIAFLRTAEIR